MLFTLSIGALARAQQQGSVRGIIYDKEFDAPLPQAQVQIVELERRVLTSEQGNYVIQQVPAGRYTLVFAKDGYIRQVRADVIVSPGQLTEINVYLSGDFTDLEEFVVQDALQLGGATEAGLLQLRFESPALLDSIGADLISRAGASDAAGALRLVAGASLADGKSAVIRGLPDRYVSSQMNGVRLPTADEDKRAVELDQFPAVVIESLQVSKTFTPDQQGDASGGAVNVRLKGIPDEPFFVRYNAQLGYNSQVAGRGNFLTYEGGGVSYWAKGNNSRRIQTGNLGDNWDGAVGVSTGQAPIDYKWSIASGGQHVFDSGLKIGGFATLFYERDSSYYNNGVDNSYWVESPGRPLTPRSLQGTPEQGDFKTALFDVTQGVQSARWGTLTTFGLEYGDHALNVVYLGTRTARDEATLAEDTRGKEYFFPGHDPNDPSSPGHDQPDAAPYLRLETLEYTERTTDTLQLNGRHKLGSDLFGTFDGLEFDWVVAKSSATSSQPDRRQFSSAWYPGTPSRYAPYKPAALFTLGNLQRVFESIEEDSEQYAANIRLPFEQWSGDKGYLKLGFFRDRVERTFDQETFSNFFDTSETFGLPFEQYWSSVFPFENHPITASEFDVDYRGSQKIIAYYAMADLPLTTGLNLVGGVRFESTEISIVNSPERFATWFPPGSTAPTRLEPGDADVAFDQDHALPSVGLIWRPLEEVTIRAAYNETIARQTFKELTPILQQEYLGGPIFIGNPNLRMSELRNYDIRLDVTPYEGGLFAVSWFHKRIKDPIEYVQRVVSFDYTTAVNYPKGEITGWELETRQDLGTFVESLTGLSVGANATLIESEVDLSEEDQALFLRPNIQAPVTSRDMTNAPDYLLNLYMTYDIAATGTQLGLFYTVQGDTLVAGAGTSDERLVPDIYLKTFDTLNFTLSQNLGRGVRFQFQAKNLTNPEIETVYRSVYTGADVTRQSSTRGIDYSVSIAGEVRF